MLFNSFNFGLFLPIVLVLYWLIGYRKVKTQNILLLVASYFFYGLWDWRFLLLILVSSLIDYYAGIEIKRSNTTSRKKFFLFFSVFWNLGILFVFKYYNFFITEFTSLFGLESSEYAFSSLNIILPVGLSFYTFQTLSYSLDIYKGRIKPTSNLLNFLCFVSFFPQLVAGPIERAGNLLPQFNKQRSLDIDNFKDGLRLILWGLFKKMVVADTVAIAVNAIYSSPEDQGSLSLFYASALFFFQIYCDFSGYSDIAIGSAKLFGFKLSKNFNIPYLSRSVSEFWQRWHITLTKWFTEYVYIPIIKNRKRSYGFKTFALFVSMSLIGLWHGANWTYVFFGIFSAIMISIERIPFKIKGKKLTISYFLNKMPLGFSVLYFTVLITTSCIFFRSDNLETSFYIINKIVSFIPSENFTTVIGVKVLVIPFLVLLEYFTRTKNHPFEGLEKKVIKPLRWAIYYIFIIAIIRYAGPAEQFIYFQF
ncbi:MAG: membrane-bound O-acyltransferase family protein [Flavobacterium sp.]|nr:MAG: membrane-bound O-acyltransferase family protein [Flavobacterium sp.]